MEQICQHCRSLLSSGTRHACHHSISQINNSELIKCDVCEAYLLCEQDSRELLHTPTFAPQAKQLSTQISDYDLNH